MILSVGGRTDIVQYYSEWLFKRFEEGYVLVRNPLFPKNVVRYELSPEKVDCIVFCSKNYRPLLGKLHTFTERYHTYFQYTITAYGKQIEPGVPSAGESMDTLLQLEKCAGKQRIAWRYDPVLLTREYPVERHLMEFEQLARPLAGHIDRAVVNFVETHRRLQVNMPEILPLTAEDKKRLAKGFGAVSSRLRMPVQICSANGDYTRYGVASDGCVTLEMLGKANGAVFRGRRHQGTREGCCRAEYRDIGARDSCLNGCKYCYANTNIEKARGNYRTHDPDSPLLLGWPQPGDIVRQGN